MNKNLQFIYFVNSINLLADNLLLPLFAVFVASIGGGVELAGTVFAAGKATQTAVSLYVIKLQDSFKLQKWSLAIGYLVKSASWMSLALWPSVPLLFVAQIAIGASGAFGSTSFNSYIAEHLDKKKHVSEYGKLNIIESVAVTLGGLIGGFVVGLSSFAVLLTGMAVLELVCFGLWTRVARR